MPADLGDLVARILLDSKEFQNAMKGVESQAQETADKAGSSLGGLSGGLDSIATAAAGVAAALGLTEFLKDALEAADKTNKLAAAFDALNGPTQETRDLFEDLAGLEFKSLYDFEETIGPAAKNMLMLGVSAEQTKETMHALVDTAADLKQTPEWINSVSDTIAKMQSHLVASQRDMKALQQEGINAWGALAAEIGTSVPEAMAKVKAGLIESQTVTEAVTKHLAELHGGAAEASLTSWKGALHILDETTEDAMVAVGNAIKNALQNAKPIIDAASAAVKALGEWFAGLPAPVQEILILVPTLVTLMAAATAGFVALQGALGALLFNPVILGITAVVAALALIGQWANENWPAIEAVFKEGVAFLSAIWKPIVDAWGPTWEGIKIVLSGVWTWITDTIGGVIEKVGAVIKWVGELSIGKNLSDEFAKLGGVWDSAQQKMADAKTAAEAATKAHKEQQAADIEAGKTANKLAAEEVARANAAKLAAEEAKKASTEFDRWFKAIEDGYAKISKTEDDWKKASIKAWASIEAQVRQSVPIIVTNLARWGEATPMGKFEASKQALEALGITSTKVYRDAIRDAEDYAEAVRIAYEAGVRSAADYNAALAVVAQKQKDLKDYTEKDVTNAYKTLGVTSTKSLEDTAIAAEAAYAKMEQSGTATATDLYNAWGAVQRAQQAVADNANQELNDAYHSLGQNTQAEMETMAQKADAAYQKIAGSAGSNSVAARDAWIKATEEAYAAQVARGEDLTTAQKNELDKRKADLDYALEQQKGTWGETYSQIRGILGNTFDEIISKLVEGDLSFAGTIKKMWQDLATAALDEFFKPLKNAITHFLAEEMADLLGGHGFGGLLQNIKDVGSGLTGIFSKTGGVTGEIPGGAPSIPDIGVPGGGGAGGVGGAASTIGSFANIFNMVTGAVSAISGVIGIFQSAKQETTLNAIEESTRYMKIGLVTQGDSLLLTSHIIRNTLTDMMAFFWSPFNEYLFKFSQDYDSLVTNVRESMHTLAALYADIHDAMPILSNMAQTLQDARDAIVDMPDILRSGFDTLNVTVTATGVTTAAAAKIMGDQIAANLSRQLVPTA